MSCSEVSSLGIDSPSEVQSLDKNQRDVVLEKLLTCGGGIRQISRITGVSFGIVQKIKKNDMITSPR